MNFKLRGPGDDFSSDIQDNVNELRSIETANSRKVKMVCTALGISREVHALKEYYNKCFLSLLACGCLDNVEVLESACDRVGAEITFNEKETYIQKIHGKVSKGVVEQKKCLIVHTMNEKNKIVVIQPTKRACDLTMAIENIFENVGEKIVRVISPFSIPIVLSDRCNHSYKDEGKISII